MIKKRLILTSILFLVVGFFLCAGFLSTPIPCNITIYRHPEQLPPEYAQYTAIDESSLIKQIDKSTVLICEQVDRGVGVSRTIKAAIRGKGLHIDVNKYVSWNDDTAEGEFYAVITIPDGVTVKTIDTRYRTIFQTVFPNKTLK